jgi:hypothetical protein
MRVDDPDVTDVVRYEDGGLVDGYTGVVRRPPEKGSTQETNPVAWRAGGDLDLPPPGWVTFFVTPVIQPGERRNAYDAHGEFMYGSVDMDKLVSWEFLLRDVHVVPTGDILEMWTVNAEGGYWYWKYPNVTWEPVEDGVRGTAPSGGGGFMRVDELGEVGVFPA